MSNKAPVLIEQQVSTEIESSSTTDGEAQLESEESELPIRPMVEIRKIFAVSSGMETTEELADESTIFYELEDVVSTMIHRCLRCLESYLGLLNRKSYRRKALKILKEAIQFTNRIE